MAKLTVLTDLWTRFRDSIGFNLPAVAGSEFTVSLVKNQKDEEDSWVRVNVKKIKKVFLYPAGNFREDLPKEAAQITGEETVVDSDNWLLSCSGGKNARLQFAPKN